MTFLAICGIDAAGKHTQSEKLKEYFQNIPGKNVIKFDLPKYESITGEMIKGYLTGDLCIELTAAARTAMRDRRPTYMSDPGTYMFQCTQLVNRLECLPDSIWHQGSNDIFIADRYNASAYAYGKAFGIDFEWLVRTHRHLPQPDVNIFLDISVEESFKRRPERRDNYERDGGMLQRVRDCYLDIFRTLGPSYAIIDASGTVDETFKEILQCLADRKLI